MFSLLSNVTIVYAFIIKLLDLYFKYFVLFFIFWNIISENSNVLVVMLSVDAMKHVKYSYIIL